MRPLFLHAQGILEVSNLGKSPTNSMAIGNDSWIAQAFYVEGGGADTNIYNLNSVQLLLDAASGSPSNLTVSIYTEPFGGGPPQTNLGALTLNSSMDPIAGGIVTYNASGITIVPGNAYFVVATAATSIAQGAYQWSSSTKETDNGTWVIDDVYYNSSDGSSWTKTIRQDVFQMAIYATPIPEPQIYALLGLSLAYVGFRRFRRSK
ncbi:MAG TPA: choice-of-anchor R domain-containing protein [Verrucomicrobiae bacterium]|nr:choice-of-anchor R domain-containing protein [Verrucomicrobiae bacterium]